MSEPADRQAEHETARKAYVYLTPEMQADADPVIRMFMGADDSCKSLLGSTNNSHRVIDAISEPPAVPARPDLSEALTL